MKSSRSKGGCGDGGDGRGSVPVKGCSGADGGGGAGGDNHNQLSQQTTGDVLSENSKMDILIRKIDKIQTDITTIKNEQKDIIKSIEHLFELNNDNAAAIEKNKADINECCKNIDSIQTSNVQLNKNFEKLSIENNNLNQYLRKNCIDLIGVPYDKNENLITILNRISLAVGFQLKDFMIDNCHRLPSTSNYKGIMQPPIIVKFVGFTYKNKFMNCFKNNKGLTLADLGFADKTQMIYVNETMSPLNRSLFKTAKTMQKAGKFQYVWFKNGRIYTRKDTNSKPVIVSSSEDLKP